MDIGMGWYQWQMFVLCGFGWLADKLASHHADPGLPLLTIVNQLGTSSMS